MNKSKLRALALTMLFALITIAAPVLAEPAQEPCNSLESDTEPLTIDGSFAYQPDESDADAQLKQAAVDAYCQQILELVKPSEARYEGATLTLEAHEVMATDDMTVITWSVTNTTDMPLYVRSSEFEASFSGIEYDLCGGWRWANYIIQPGQTLQSRFSGVLWEHFEPGHGAFELKLHVYEIAPDAIPDDYYTSTTDYTAGEYFPPEDGLNLLEDISFNVPIDMGASAVRSALKDGEPITRDCGRYELRVTRADMNLVNTFIEYERIYPTREDALNDSPIGSTYWQYQFLDSAIAIDSAQDWMKDMEWISSGFGSIPDEPVELDDGRWAWRITYRAYYMHWQPQQLLMRELYYNGEAGYSDGGSEDIVLDFGTSMTEAATPAGRKFTWDYGFVQL